MWDVKFNLKISAGWHETPFNASSLQRYIYQRTFMGYLFRRLCPPFFSSFTLKWVLFVCRECVTPTRPKRGVTWEQSDLFLELGSFLFFLSKDKKQNFLSFADNLAVYLSKDMKLVKWGTVPRLIFPQRSQKKQLQYRRTNRKYMYLGRFLNTLVQ